MAQDRFYQRFNPFCPVTFDYTLRESTIEHLLSEDFPRWPIHLINECPGH